MKQIALFSLIMQTKLGGAFVFTAHLHRAFEKMGFEPLLFRVTKRMSSKTFEFTHGIPCQDITAEAAVHVASAMPSVVCYAEWLTHSESILKLLDSGVTTVLHDPAQFSDGYIAAMKASQEPVIAIRRAGEKHFRSLGLNASFIPHPYVPDNTSPLRTPVRNGAVSVTRVDWRKKTDMICGANRLLEPKQRIQMHGALNRLFAYGTLDKKYPGWRDNYAGPFSTEWGSALNLLRRAEVAVDLTDITGGGGWDGGGSQYAFMEAWEAGTPLVINRNWLRGKDDSMREGDTCLAVANAGELAQVVSVMVGAGTYDKEQFADAGFFELTKHVPAVVVPQYMRLMDR